jgi:hypothetical protein
MCETTTFLTDKTFLQDVLSALIGTGTALLIFYLTIKSDKNKEKKSLKKETNNRIRNFINLIHSSINHAETTITNLEEIIANYDKNILDFQLLRFSPNKSFERLDEHLKNELYFQSYSKKYGKENVDTFNRISLIIDYFNMQFNQLWDIIQKAQEYDYQRKLKFKNLSNNILNGIAKLTITDNTGINSNDIDKLGSLLVDFHNGMTENADLNYLYAFNRNSLELVLKRYISNPKVTDLIELIRDSSLLFDEIHKQNYKHKEDLESVKLEMNNSLMRYKEETKNLN